MTMTRFTDMLRTAAVVVLNALATFLIDCSVTLHGWADYLDNK